MNNIEQLLEALKKVDELMTEENIKNASTEQLFEYMELINRIKATVISKM